MKNNRWNNLCLAGPVTITSDMVFTPAVTESNFDAIKDALAKVLGINAADISLSFKTTLIRQVVLTKVEQTNSTTLVVIISTTDAESRKLLGLILSGDFVGKVNVELASDDTIRLNVVNGAICNGCSKYIR